MEDLTCNLAWPFVCALTVIPVNTSPSPGAPLYAAISKILPVAKALVSKFHESKSTTKERTPVVGIPFV